MTYVLKSLPGVSHQPNRSGDVNWAFPQYDCEALDIVYDIVANDQSTRNDFFSIADSRPLASVMV